MITYLPSYLIIDSWHKCRNAFLFFPLIGSFNNHNWTKNKIYSKNSNKNNRVNIIDGIDNEISWADELLFTDLNHTKNKSHNNHYDISNRLLDNKILFIEKIPPNHSNSNYNKSKYHGDNTVIDIMTWQMTRSQDKTTVHLTSFSWHGLTLLSLPH